MDIYKATEKFYERFRGEKRVIGKSAFDRKLFAVKLGDGSPVGISQYAIHGREFITARLAFEHSRVGLFKGSVWLVPLVDPDGALLSEVGLKSVRRAKDRAFLCERNGGSEDFSLWKANGRGVDLNVNFDAAWGTGAKNVSYAGAENYIGKKPFSEPETLALKRFTEKIKPDYTVSWHTKGEEIYWYFDQGARYLLRDKRLAGALSASTGYPLAHAAGSAGGYKDWCITALHIPAFTVEAGSDGAKHPIREETAGDLFERNRMALYDLSKEF